MFNKVLRVALFLFVFLFPINLFASVADLHLKLPFPDGETWHTSCAYNGTGTCSTHGAGTKDRYALDFNFGSGDDDLGKSIRAAAGGRAEIYYGNTGYGNYVLLDHGNGYVTRYAHLQSISVKNNKWVLQGQEVGKCGNSGTNFSHLHFVLYHDGQAEKPEPMGGYGDLSPMDAWYTSANGDPVFRTVAYESDEFKGALVLVREDGEFPQDCDNDQTIFYRQWREGGSWSNFMEVIPLDWDSGAYEYCSEAAYGGFDDVDLANIIDGHILVEEGMGGYSGPGYDDDTGGDTWAGYDHHVGLKYMKIGKKSSGDWDDSVTWSLNEIPDKKDFRIKLKQKGGVWPDEACAEVWFSHNKNFTSSDLYLKQKCKDLSDETESQRSVYVKDVDIPDMEAGKNYYFFTRVTYSGGVNPSSDDDHDEHVKVDVVEGGSGQGSAQWQSFSNAKKAAIMSIIFD